jgi:multidrug efflux pump subunit AcrA (membrane-fusion protein)
MFANLTVTTGAPADVLTLPRTAIVYSLYGDNVFVVKPAPASPPAGPGAQAAQPASGATPAPAPAVGLVVERRFVHVGAARGERIAIEDGVKAGEQVVTAGQVKLQASSPVTIDNTIALPPPPVTPNQ